MEPTEFEKWCAYEMGHTIAYIVSARKEKIFGGYEYKHSEINIRYRAWIAGVTSMLPYKTPAKGATNVSMSWIKTSDQLPEDAQWCAVYLVDGVLNVACYDDNQAYWQGENYNYHHESVKCWLALPPEEYQQ